MSFKFDTSKFEDNTFNNLMKDLLTRSLNSDDESQRPDILRSAISIRDINFPVPQLEILDLDIQNSNFVKGILKINIRGASIKINTDIESNLLLIYVKNSNPFTTPKMISNLPFSLPMTIVLDKIKVNAIANVFVKKNGLGLSFQDVNFDFVFDSSISILKPYIEQRLKSSIEEVFKEVLPSAIFNTSQKWFSPTMAEHDAPTSPRMKTILDESDLADLSPINMLKLSTLNSSRQTLALSVTEFEEVMERLNLYKFDSKIPSLSNYVLKKAHDLTERSTSIASDCAIHPRHIDEPNTLCRDLLNNSTTVELEKVVTDVASIQSRIYERSGGPQVRRRRIKMGKSSQTAEPETVQNTKEEVESVSDAETAVSDVLSETSEALSSTETHVEQSTPELEPIKIAYHETMPFGSPESPKRVLSPQPVAALRIRELRLPSGAAVAMPSPRYLQQSPSKQTLYSPMKTIGVVGLGGYFAPTHWGDDSPPPYR